MNIHSFQIMSPARWLLCLLLLVGSFQARAVVDGIIGPIFNLTAAPAYIITADGDSLLVWAYGVNGGVPQYPGPTMIVNQGQTVQITLTKSAAIPENVSMVFPGQRNVQATGGVAGLLTRESTGTGDTVTYTFTADHAGTYLYHSGTRPELQIEMGLVGAMIVRPNVPNQAYSHPSSAYDQEYLFLLSEMDPQIHHLIDFGFINQIDNTAYHPVLWFINGRNAPDTMADAYVPWFPNQPYNSMPRTHPGEKMLLRVIGAGRDLHPFHTHGNNISVIARDGRLLESTPGAGADLAHSEFTLQTPPGATFDALFSWDGRELGWDIYGHASGDPLAPHEYAPNHGMPVPVTMPELQSLTFGGFWSGSPYLGQSASLPPGEGGLNMNNGLIFMWHSHTEREMVNNDIFPGGMMTMAIIEPPGISIP